MLECQTNEYASFNDTQFISLLHYTIESYLKFKRCCDIAKQILKDNCHDFVFSIDSSERECNYNNAIRVANQRNIPVDFSVYNLECSLEEVAYILNAMCGLELTWLDEHRYIFSNEGNDSYLEEEEKTLGFYSSLISGLNLEQISMAEDNLDDLYMLYL